MTKALRYVHGLLQHDNAKWNPGDPADETDNTEDTEEGEDNGSRVIMAVKVVNACPDAEDDMQDTGDPDELLCEGSCGGEVSPGKSKGAYEDECEKNDGIGVEGEVVGSIVDAAAAKVLVGRIAL